MKNQVRFYAIVILLSIPLIYYLIRFYREESLQYEKMETNGILDTAIIVREFYGAKRKLYFEYVFYAGNKKCNGFLAYSPSFGSIEIGDSCLVLYLPEDPDEINELKIKENFELIKINR